MMGVELVVAMWLMATGACVGSFLNVVIHRLPAGQSLMRPASRCPKCKQPIRYYHNIPVLGWLLLRGKCNDCGEPISARYPLIEFMVSVLFVVIYGFVFHSAGADIGDTWTSQRLWSLYAALVVLACAVVCMVAIRIDDARIPNVVYAVGIASALAAAAIAWL